MNDITMLDLLSPVQTDVRRRFLVWLSESHSPLLSILIWTLSGVQSQYLCMIMIVALLGLVWQSKDTVA